MYVAAGLPRSGSTLVYNVLRELLQFKHGEIVSYWCKNSPETVPENSIELIKTHRLIRRYRNSMIFFTFRDIRTVAVSAFRMFDYPICMRTIRSYVRESFVALSSNAYMLKYERWRYDPVYLVSLLAEILGVLTSPKKVYLDVIRKMETEDFNLTQFHPNHITNTKDEDWNEVIPVELQNKIKAEFSCWFECFGYQC